ncbi:MAG: DUF4330 domain-containing protein [Clostridiales bacterium]|nr:DUF4330 domain-containing protein [Clostridiales bacterium]
MDDHKKKYRLFGLISPVDVLIVGCVAAFALWAALVFSAPRTVSAKEGGVLLRFTVEVKEKPEGFFEGIGTGATLYDTLKGYAIGEIVEVYASPYLEDAPDEAGNRWRRTAVDGLEFTYIVAEAYAQVTDAAISVGQYEIAVNKEVFVNSKDFAGNGYITEIKNANGEAFK